MINKNITLSIPKLQSMNYLNLHNTAVKHIYQEKGAQAKILLLNKIGQLHWNDAKKSTSKVSNFLFSC